MKKTIYAIAALALLFTGCAKEINETFVPGDVVTVRAKVNDTYTKVAADNAGTFSWQADDKITILNDSGDPYDFTTDTGMSDAPFTCTTFEGSLTAEAFYPASSNHTSGKFYLEPTFAWKDGETNMPMLGTVNTGTKAVSFKTAGAAIKLVCYNVSADARKLVVSSDSKKLSGEFTPTGDPGDPKAIVSEDSDSEKTITITFDSPSSTMVFYIPVPTGNLGRLTFVLKDSSDANVSFPQRTKDNITMSRQHIVAAPALNCGGTVLWSEDFSDYASGDVPSGFVYKGYGGASVSYACTDGGGTTKIYEQSNADGLSPELLVGKSNGTFEVTDIPTNGASSMVLRYKTNAYELTLSSPTSGISFSSTSTNTKEEHTIVITNSTSADKFGITFKATSGSNVRLDDIVLLIPDSITAPTITVTGEEDLEIDKAGGSATTTFTYSGGIDSNPVSATVEEGKTWLTASLSGSGPYTLTVSAAENTGSLRSATVTIRATGVSKIINVSQPSSVGKIQQTLFHETFGDNSGSARAWNNTYSVKSGLTAVYSGITGYTVTNAKQGKNTTGSTLSGLNQTTKGTDAVLIIGPLAVANAEDMVLTYQWNAGSIKETYSTSLYYATSSGGSYTEVAGTGAGATSFVERSYSLPAAAQVNTLYLKIVWNTSNTGGIIDEVDLNGKY